jgi:polysaccharide biosynthesis/export protein
VKNLLRLCLAAVLPLVAAVGCSSQEAPLEASAPPQSNEYLIGPLDTLQIFVWRNPEVSTTVPVRPDGRISTPLIEDLTATGKTPQQLAREIEGLLKNYILDPVVTVIVTNFSGPLNKQVRVVGEAAKPQAIPYRENMTLLDLMIAVGGLTEFAAGNRATLVREVGNEQKQYRVRLADLMKGGDVSANVKVSPGDVLIIPQSWF